MAKLSLWLLTLAKDKPFEFLDHALRAGDSLVGLHNLDQLRHYSLKPDADDAILFSGPLDTEVDEAIKLRLRLAELQPTTLEEVKQQVRLHREATDKMARLRCAADLLVAAEFWGTNARDKQERVRHNAVRSGHYLVQGPTAEFEEVAAKERRGQTMFHWPLEFPEVIVKRGGFDAVVGNPPFMGGKKITGSLGTSFRDFIVSDVANQQKGHSDLCAYFLLRAGRLVREPGALGYLTTNTISQGDTREIGIEQLTSQGFSIRRAVASIPWPGLASLEVSHLWLYLGTWKGMCILDDATTNGITSFLTPSGSVDGAAHRIRANEDRSFVGSYVLGMGFVLTADEAQQLLDRNQSNRDVIFPYLNGDDLNSRPDQSASRYVINFFDWPIERAMEYQDCFHLVEERVKPRAIARRPETRWPKYCVAESAGKSRCGDFAKPGPAGNGVGPWRFHFFSELTTTLKRLPIRESIGDAITP